MSTVFLRELLESGFCGKHRTLVAKTGLGKVHAALDQIIAEGHLDQLANDSWKIQLANKHQIPYEHKPHFDLCLKGIFGFRHRFSGDGVSVKDRTTSLAYGPSIRHTEIREKETSILVEPVYSYYMPEHRTPFYALMSAVLSDWKASDLKIRMVSVCSEEGFEDLSLYHVIDELRQILVDSLNEDKIKIGHACTVCPMQDCKFNNKFDSLMYAWMKAKQCEEGLKEQVREHLVWHGPTKVGAHLAYMKEHTRRSLLPKQFPAFYQQLQEIGPDHIKYLGANASAVFAAVEKGELPKGMIELFKRTRYYSVETGLSL